MAFFLYTVTDFFIQSNSDSSNNLRSLPDEGNIQSSSYRSNNKLPKPGYLNIEYTCQPEWHTIIYTMKTSLRG